MLPTGLCAQIACIWEATARKPGNVHRYQDFIDLSYTDFILSAAAVAPILDDAARRRVGETILKAVQATRRLVPTNTNLGILLLLAPLSAVARDADFRAGLERTLAGLDVRDAQTVYSAIRLATPGGMGRVRHQDIHDKPTMTLREVMELAADRDLVARQYANGFREVLDEGVPAFLRGLEETQTLETAIIRCHLELMASHPDSLISRKCGPAEAAEASARARRVLECLASDARGGLAAVAELDTWLRAEGNRRNPGTTADLVTACLFVILREGKITVPCSYPWSAGSAHG
jgi:triphosphoribosyl-dephospho-CoA synthase